MSIVGNEPGAEVGGITAVGTTSVSLATTAAVASTCVSWGSTVGVFCKTTGVASDVADVSCNAIGAGGGAVGAVEQEEATIRPAHRSTIDISLLECTTLVRLSFGNLIKFLKVIGYTSRQQSRL
jgi:hypothetical protein